MTDSAGRGRNRAAALAFLRGAGLKVSDDPRAAALLSAAVALDVGWDAATSRELRMLRRELADGYGAVRRTLREPAAPPVPDPGVSERPVSIVERLKRRSS